MITGHFATALVPYVRDRKLPLFALLLASQAQDLLIPLDIAVSGQRNFRLLEMTLSHDLVPALVIALVVGIALHLAYRSTKVTAIGIGLVLFHEACDLLSGFAHNVLGPDTPRLGFDFYRSAPATAFIIEFALALVCVGYFLFERRRQGDPVAPVKAAVLCAVIFLPILAMLVRAISGKPVF